MKIVLVGAHGTIGKAVNDLLNADGHEVIQVGRKTGDYHLKIENPEEVAQFYKKLGTFDAVACAAGEVAFAPFAQTQTTQWMQSFQSKLMGQINLVHQSLPYIQEKGSFTLISGILGDEHILAGSVAATVNSALEGFVKAAACELPKGLRINAVSPTVLEESMHKYASFFPGFIPVPASKVAQAYKRSILGVQTGRVFRVI